MASMFAALNSRVARIFLALMLVLVIVTVGWSHVVETVSTDAVVNAPRLVLSAPGVGTLDHLDVHLGQAVEPGDILARFTPSASGGVVFGSGLGGYDELKSRATVLKAKVSAIDTEMASMQAMASDLESRSQAYTSANTRHTSSRVGEESARVSAAKARLGNAQVELSRIEQLYQRNVATLSELDQARAEVAANQAEYQKARASVSTTSAEREAVQAGYVISQGTKDVPYTRQRYEEIQLRLAGLRADREAAVAELSDVQRRMKETYMSAANLAADSGGSNVLRAPARGVVWRVQQFNGAHLGPGQTILELVDCSNVIVEARIPERSHDDIRIGTKALVRLVGSDKDIDGTVRQVLGSNIVSDQNYAATLPAQARPQARVVISLNIDAAQAAASACEVGRGAQVKFLRDSVGVTTGTTNAQVNDQLKELQKQTEMLRRELQQVRKPDTLPDWEKP